MTCSMHEPVVQILVKVSDGKKFVVWSLILKGHVTLLTMIMDRMVL